MTILQSREIPLHRGRPRSEDLDGAIFEAALEVFSEVGFHGLTFEAVAQRAGCKRPAIYRRFANRRELMVQLMSRLIRNVDPVPPSTESPRVQLIKYLSAFVSLLTGRGGGVTIALALARQSDPELAAACDEMFKSETAVYEEALQEAVGGGAPANLVRLLVDATLGAATFRVAMRKEIMSEAEIEQLVDVMIQAARSAAA